MIVLCSPLKYMCIMFILLIYTFIFKITLETSLEIWPFSTLTFHGLILFKLSLGFHSRALSSLRATLLFFRSHYDI